MSAKKVTIYLLSSAFLFSAVYLPLNMIKQGEEVVPSKEQVNNEILEETYTIRSHNGKISVFSQNGEQPLYTLDSPFVRDLPEYDQKLLNEGIVANSEQELMKLLEDYDY